MIQSCLITLVLKPMETWGCTILRTQHISNYSLAVVNGVYEPTKIPGGAPPLYLGLKIGSIGKPKSHYGSISSSSAFLWDMCPTLGQCIVPAGDH